jgi:hypothetical protein
LNAEAAVLSNAQQTTVFSLWLINFIVMKDN